MKVTISLGTALLLLLAAMFSPALAQSALSGTWTIQPGASANEVQLDLRYQQPDGTSKSETSHDFDVRSLGLSDNDLTSAPHPVHFTLRRDAGVLDLTGEMGTGVGAGHYTFTPNASYPQALASRGLDRPDEQRQLAAALLDVSLSYIDSIVAAGVRPSSFDKLMAFRALGVTAESIKTLQRAFGSMSEEQIITFTALRITPEYANQMRALGLTGLDRQALVSLKALRIDAAYVHEMASLGYDHLSAQDLTELKALRIDAGYIRRVQSHGYKHPTVQQLVQLRALRII